MFRAGWDYPDDALIPLCQACHQILHENYQVLIRHLHNINNMVELN